MQLGESIRVADGVVSCTHCDATIGPADENVKTELPVREGPVTSAGPTFVDTSRFVDEEMVFREFFCPDCATLLFTETAREGDDVVDEFTIDSA